MELTQSQRDLFAYCSQAELDLLVQLVNSVQAELLVAKKVITPVEKRRAVADTISVRRRKIYTTTNLKLLPFLFFCISVTLCAAAQTVIRAGHLPNVTHGQALLGRANGAFEK